MVIPLLCSRIGHLIGDRKGKRKYKAMFCSTCVVNGEKVQMGLEGFTNSEFEKVLLQREQQVHLHAFKTKTTGFLEGWAGPPKPHFAKVKKKKKTCDMDFIF